MHVVYAASTLALAALEYLIHVDPVDVPSDLLAVALVIPHGTVVDVESRATVPSDWRAGAGSAACQQIAAWVASGVSLGLAVPSVIIPGERNLLLNPAHAEMLGIDVRSSQPFQFDPRLYSTALSSRVGDDAFCELVHRATDLRPILPQNPGRAAQPRGLLHACGQRLVGLCMPASAPRAGSWASARSSITSLMRATISRLTSPATGFPSFNNRYLNHRLL